MLTRSQLFPRSFERYSPRPSGSNFYVRCPCGARFVNPADRELEFHFTHCPEAKPSG